MPQKLTNFQKKEKKKRTFFGTKNELGLSLRRKNDFSSQKCGGKLIIRDKILQKSTFWPKKNKLGLRLSRKTGFFGQKIDKFKKKNDFSGQKNKLGLSKISQTMVQKKGYKFLKMSPKQSFATHFESIYGKKLSLIPKGINKRSFPRK